MSFADEYKKGIPSKQLERLYFLKDYFDYKSPITLDNPLKIEKIQDLLEEKGYPHSINTVYSYIKILREEFDMNIQYAYNYGYIYSKKEEFTPSDLRLMVDSIQASGFITQKKADEITRKITELSGTELAKTLNRRAFNTDRVHSMNDSIMSSADNFYVAISKNSKIAFRYIHYTFDNNFPNKRKKEEREYVVSPYNMFWDNGNFYCYAYVDKKNGFKNFRVDRMENISKPLLKTRDGRMEYDRKAITDRKAKVFGGYVSNEETYVKLVCQNRLADYIVEQFGDARLNYYDEKHFYCVPFVNLSPPFYAWVATFGHSIRIAEPEEAVEGMKKFLKDASDMYKD